MLQFGDQGRWSNGPKPESKLNVPCKDKPPVPGGSDKIINWYLEMIPAVRCVVKGLILLHMIHLETEIISGKENVTFTWIENADKGNGHNVNHWYNDQTAWDNCDFKDVAESFTNTSMIPNYVFDSSNQPTGWHYFACGLFYQPGGGHCSFGVKAKVYVANQPSECPFHYF